MAKTFLIRKDGTLRVRKEIDDSNSILGMEKFQKQLDWLLALDDDVTPFFPKIIEHDTDGNYAYYDMTYYPMPTLSDYVISTGKFDRQIQDIVLQTLRICAKINREVQTDRDGELYLKRNHLGKMLDRCRLVLERDATFRSFFHADGLYINGKGYSNLTRIVDKIRNDRDLLHLLAPRTWHRSHGDFTFQNILTDGTDLRIIDPRGGDTDTVYYDIGKILQSCHGKYDLLYEGNYTCGYVEENPSIEYKIIRHEDVFNRIYTLVSESIPTFFGLDDHWRIRALFYEGSHFISMVPFRYVEGLEITLVCYAIGIQILNEVLYEWNGKDS